MDLQLDSSYDSIYRRAQFLADSGELGTALEEARRLVRRLERLKPSLLKLRPELTDLHQDSVGLLADLEARAGNLDQAIALTEKLMALDPQGTSAHLRQIAEFEVARGNVEQGLQDLRALVEAEPDNSWNALTLGDVLFCLRRYNEARECLLPLVKTRWEEEDPLPQWASMRLFMAAEECRDLDGAVEAWQLSRKHTPDPTRVQGLLWRLVALLAQGGDFERAGTYLGRLQSWHMTQFLRGYMQRLRGDEEAARLIWQRMGDREQKEPWDKEANIRTLLMLRRGEEVSRFLVSSLTIWGFSWTAILWEGIAEAQQGHLEEAVLRMKSALDDYRQYDLLRKLPVYERRLFERVLEPEAWEKLAPFFDEEPAQSGAT
ncbi:MAG: tetratricopeptide repeat protein [Anaerolineae bacterium]